MLKFALLALVAAQDPALETITDHVPEACTEGGEPDPDCCSPMSRATCAEPYILQQGDVCFEGDGSPEVLAHWYRCLPEDSPNLETEEEEEEGSATRFGAAASLLIAAAALY